MQLLYLRPYIEEQLPGLEIYLCFRQDVEYLVQNHARILYQNEITDKKRDFAHIKILQCNMKQHPILELFSEAQLEIPCFAKQHENYQNKPCIISTNGVTPTRSLNNKEIEIVKALCIHEGFTKGEIIVNGDISTAGLVVGVENEHLFLAGFNGVKTVLIESGLGNDFYAKLFRGKIITL